MASGESAVEAGGDRQRADRRLFADGARPGRGGVRGGAVAGSSASPAGAVPEVRRKREAVASLVGRIGSADAGQARDRNSVAIETYRALTRQHLQTDLELVEAQAGLEELRAARGPAPGDPSRPDGEVVAAFYADPQVAEAQARLVRARDGLSKLGRFTKAAGDRERAASRKKGRRPPVAG